MRDPAMARRPNRRHERADGELRMRRIGMNDMGMNDMGMNDMGLSSGWDQLIGT
jgi:hypothetical protein